MKKLQILGTGCPKCQTLAERTEAAAKQLGLDYQLEKVSSIQDIMKFGVMMTPALAIDGTVKCMGKLPTVDEIKTMLKE